MYVFFKGITLWFCKPNLHPPVMYKVRIRCLFEVIEIENIHKFVIQISLHTHTHTHKE